MDRLEAMSLLIEVTDGGSLSAASRRLGVPLATLSRKISELEAHLNARLLIRSSRRTSLTEAGQSYVAACRRILEQVGEAERAASGEFTAPKGHLTLTAPIVFGRLHVLPVVTEFLAAYPEITLRLTLADHVVDMQAGHIDAALRIGHLPDSALTALRVGEVRRVTCASPSYLAAHGTPRTPADLRRHHCITFEGLASPGSWRFHTAKGAEAFAVTSRLTVNTAEAAADAAMAGLGITRLLSYQVTAPRRAGALVLLLEDFEPPAAPVSLVYDGQGPLALKTRAFLDFAAPRLRAGIAADAE
jgi:DNA-binding transcriptional LysR family regulator